jgi:hypothetical protein
MDWKPIETAPKDGTAIILCWAVTADKRPIDWRESPTTAGVFVQIGSWSEGENWWWVYIDTPGDTALHFTPTHWMALPSPPVAEETK